MNELFFLLKDKATDNFMPFLMASHSIFILVGLLLLSGLIIFTIMAGLSMVGAYSERKISAYIQGRMGPNRVGPCGLYQPIADLIKLMAKENVVPHGARRFGYTAAPILVFLGAFLPFVALNFSEHFVISGLGVGLYYIVSFAVLVMIGVLMAAWAPGNKWSLLGGLRLAVQMLAYTIPMGFCIVTIVLLTGSLNLNEIVKWQSEGFWILGWTIFRSPAAFLAFFIFFIAGMVSAKRAPFDLPEAESELVAGYHTEYTGLRFAIFSLSEYATMYVVCALTAILFLGGWIGPIPTPTIGVGRSLLGDFYDLTKSSGSYWEAIVTMLNSKGDINIMFKEFIGFVNLLLKTLLLYFVMIWVRWTIPRIRIDQVLYIGFKVLLPFSMLCILIAAIQISI